MWKEVVRTRLRPSENCLEAVIYECDGMYSVWYEGTDLKSKYTSRMDFMLKIFFSEQEARMYYDRIVDCVGVY